MKLVDEKGKLFGIVNLIDFFVILFLLAMIPGLYFGYKVITQKPKPPFGSNIKEIVLSCQLIKLKPDVAELISVDDIELDKEGRVIGEIVGLDASEPYEADPTLRQRSARLKLEAQFKGNDLYYKDRVIDYDSEIDFKTVKYNEIARGKEDLTKMLNIGVTLKGLDKDMVDLIAIGDKEVDATGQTVAKIVKIAEPEDNSFGLYVYGNYVTFGKDPDKKQIATEMSLRCQVIKEDGEDQIYFKGKKITLNSPIEFATDKYKAKGSVSKTL